MTGPPLRIGLWIAVSSPEQAAFDKSSLADQEQAGRRFAESLGAAVVAVYSVPGHTRKYWNWYDCERDVPAYRQVREDLESNRVDLIHALDSDRLGRTGALILQFYALAAEYGAEVYVASAPHIIGQPTTSQQYVASIKAVGAQEDNERRTYRHRSGMRGRVLRDGLHPGRIPFGMAAIRDEQGNVLSYEPDSQAEAVRFATARFLEGLSYQAIGKAVTAAGFGRWTRRGTYAVLHRDFYAGLVTWGSVRLDTPSPKVVPIWDAATFAAIVAERRRRSHGPYNRDGGGPFAGVAYCARCGKRLTRFYKTLASGARVYRWRCSTHATKATTGAACHPNAVREEDLTATVTAFLAEFCTPEAVDLALAQIQVGGQADALARDLAAAKSALDELERKRERVALAYASGAMPLDVYARTEETLRGQTDAETHRVADLGAMLASVPDVAQRRVELLALPEWFTANVGIGAAQMATALQSAGVRVWCENGEPVRAGLV